MREPTEPDADGDGVRASADCDDADPAAWPGAREVCGDAADQDCDGEAEACRHEGEIWLDPDEAGADAVFVMPDLEGTRFYGESGHAGDLDGDGYGDVATMMGDDWSSWTLCIVPGPLSGRIDLQAHPEACVGRVHSEEYFGWVVFEPAGDVDGDGFDDLVVANDYARPGGVSEAGAVWVLRGPLVGDIFLDDIPPVVEGRAEDEDVGTSVSVGDVDGDGWGDLLVGASGLTSDVYLFSGPLDGTRGLADADIVISGTQESGPLGDRVALGDLDGDGMADIAVGTTFADDGDRSSGGVYVFYGPTAGAWTADDADAVIFGEFEGDGAGSTITAAPALDGDSTAHLLVAARGWGEQETPRAYHVPMPVYGRHVLGDTGHRIIGREMWQIGRDLTAAGDVNGDERMDFLLSGEETHLQRGETYVVLGPVERDLRVLEDGLALFRETFLYGASSGMYGVGFVRGWGDLDADGYSDVLLDAAGWDDTYSEHCGSLGSDAPIGGCSEGAIFTFLGGVAGE
ncbi:integrin alpha [Myxococcota bacterium]|nr:integrin alpha [Myxococcota bacterium]